MPMGKFDWKYWVGAAFSVVALVVSVYAFYTSKQLADEAFAPRLGISDLQLEGTNPDDPADREPILHYKMQNQGRSTLRDIKVALAR